MNSRFPIMVAFFLLAGSPAAAQTTAAPCYPSAPPERAPQTQQGVPIGDLTSPVCEGQSKITRTAIDSDAEAQLFMHALKIGWGRYPKGVKPGQVTITKQNGLWTVKGRIETEGDWVTIDGIVERIATKNVQLRGEVAFRVAKVEKGTPCRVAGTLHFKRSGKSQIWRLVEGDNPCDGTQEKIDLVYAKPAAKQPVPQARRS